ncbi:hypothetical protein AAMO2058_000030300 [Amorphochlora amoebiformis]
MQNATPTRLRRIIEKNKSTNTLRRRSHEQLRGGKADVVFGSKSYWEKRYQTQCSNMQPNNGSTLFEWYCGYSSLQGYVYEMLNISQEFRGVHSDEKANVKILVIGCGNSKLSHDMHKDGFANTQSMDYSEIVIKHMKKLYPHLAHTYHVENMLNISLPDACKDLVLDKGALDAIFCGDNSYENIKIALTHISRILKPGGWYLMMSYAPREHRVHHLNNPDFRWEIFHTELDARPKPLTTPDTHFSHDVKHDGSNGKTAIEQGKASDRDDVDTANGFNSFHLYGMRKKLDEARAGG